MPEVKCRTIGKLWQDLGVTPPYGRAKAIKTNLLYIILFFAGAIAMPIDLLYLYYAGAWGEPILPILITELIFLYCYPIVSIAIFISLIKKLK